MYKSRIASILLLAFSILSGCGDDNPVNTGNQTPTVRGVLATPLTIIPGGKSEIIVNASDPDGDTLLVSYNATGGTIETNEAGRTFFKADTVEGVAWVTATIADRKGGVTTGKATINILRNPPLITIGAQVVDTSTPEVQCLLFSALPQETIFLDNAIVENPIGERFVFDPLIVEMPGGLPFSLQDSGICYSIHSGEYKFIITYRESQNGLPVGNPIEFPTITHVQP